MSNYQEEKDHLQTVMAFYERENGPHIIKPPNGLYPLYDMAKEEFQKVQHKEMLDIISRSRRFITETDAVELLKKLMDSIPPEEEVEDEEVYKNPEVDKVSETERLVEEALESIPKGVTTEAQATLLLDKGMLVEHTYESTDLHVSEEGIKAAEDYGIEIEELHRLPKLW